MLLCVGKLKKPSRQLCQQFTEMYLISEAELSHEHNLILLHYHSKMPEYLDWGGKALNLSAFQQCMQFNKRDKKVTAKHVPILSVMHRLKA